MIYTPGPSCEIPFEDAPHGGWVDKGEVILNGKVWHIVAQLHPDRLRIRLSFYEHKQDLTGKNHDL